MILSHLLKPILIFLGGVLVALLLVQLSSGSGIAGFLAQKKSPTQIEREVKEEIYTREEKAAKSLTQTILEKVLPATVENPVLEPIIGAKRDIEHTVEVLRGLPEEQRNAICKQVCGE